VIVEWRCVLPMLILDNISFDTVLRTMR